MINIDSFLNFLSSIDWKITFLIMLGSFLLSFLGQILYLTFKYIREEYKNPASSSTQLSVSKIEFIRQIVGWCVENLGMPPKINRWPNITLRYYQHKKFGGLYHQPTKEITVYWANNPRLMDIVDIVIHEYQHFLDIRNGKHDEEYESEMQRVGYHNNPFEIRARKASSQWGKACFDELRRRGIIYDK
jgi:hypothetical protein